MLASSDYVLLKILVIRVLVQFSKGIYIAQLIRMLHCAPEATF